MNRVANVLYTLALAFLCGCGGAADGLGGGGGGGGGSRGGTQPPDPSMGGNWQLSLASTAGQPPATIAGSITQSGGSLSGAFHLDGSNCYDPANTVGVTGTLSGNNNNISLTSTSMAGQIITLTGRITNNTAVGAYAISGGCANGDQGSLKGFKIPVLTGGWRVHTIVSDQVGSLRVSLSQGDANADGSFGLSGSTSNATYFVCDEGTIASGTLTTSGSWIFGTQVFLQVQTANGRVDFSGTADPAGSQIRGGLQYFDGPCDGLSGEATFSR